MKLSGLMKLFSVGVILSLFVIVSGCSQCSEKKNLDSAPEAMEMSEDPNSEDMPMIDESLPPDAEDLPPSEEMPPFEEEGMTSEE
jgi:PBP1b-binding outer membrane lipoprotein LpoB